MIKLPLDGDLVRSLTKTGGIYFCVEQVTKCGFICACDPPVCQSPPYGIQISDKTVYTQHCSYSCSKVWTLFPCTCKFCLAIRPNVSLFSFLFLTEKVEA